MMCRKTVILVALTVGLAAAPATADVTVLGLRSLDGDESLADTLTKFVRSFIASRGIDTVAANTQTLEQMAMISDCPDDVTPACLRDMAGALGAQEMIYGFLTRMGEGTRFTYSLDLRRFSTSRRRDVGSAQGTFESTRQGTANLQILANSLLDTLYERRPATSFIVQSNEPGAAVFVDGRRVGETGAEPLWVTGIEAGNRDVRIEKDGFDPWERTIQVSAGDYRLVEAPLAEIETRVAAAPPRLPVPVAIPEPPVAAAPEEDDEPGYWSDWRAIAGWGAAGGGVVLAGIGIGFTAAVAGINDDPDFAAFRAQTLVGEDSCARARASGQSDIIDLCDSGETYAILQFVMYGLSAAALGTGAYFVVSKLLEEGETESDASAGGAGEIALVPFGAPGGGGFVLAGWF